MHAVALRTKVALALQGPSFTIQRQKRRREHICEVPLDSSISPAALADGSRVTIHNVHYLLTLMGRARQAIIEDRYPRFIRAFFGDLYSNDSSKYPMWAVIALKEVGVDLLDADL